MKTQNLNRIAELRYERRWNQSELAEAVGAHKITISKLERGEMRLTQDWMQRLAKALKVTPSEILADSSLIRTVYIDGLISEKFEIEYEKDEDLTEQELATEFKIDYGIKPPNVSLFFNVGTEIFNPIIHVGDMVRFSTIDDRERGFGDEFILGRLAVLEVESSELRLIGILERGSEEGVFDLRHPLGGYRRGVRPTRIFVLTLVLGVPDVQIGEDGAPL